MAKEKKEKSFAPPENDENSNAAVETEESGAKLYYNKESEGMRLRLLDSGIEIKFERGYYKATKKSEQKAIEASSKFKRGWIVIVPAGSDTGVMMHKGPVTTSQKVEETAP